MGKSIVDSFSFPVEEVVVLEKFVKIAERERKSKSALIMELVRQYIKEHGDGNPAYSLTKWVQDSDFKVTPAFFESQPKWKQYLEKCDRPELEKVEGKALAIREIARKLWLEKRK